MLVNEKTQQKKNLDELNRLLKERWDQIAAEYYTSMHPTSRNFDTVIDFYLPDYLKILRQDGIFLDLGCGAGKVHKFISSNDFKIVCGDISMNMLKIVKKTSKNSLLIQLSAFQLPFCNEAFDGVVSILGDSYLLSEVFQEVWRILKFDALLIIVLPTKLWASLLRPKLGIQIDKTVLVSQLREMIEVPSFLYSETELKNHLLDAGFSHIEIRSVTAKDVIAESEFSQHILLAAREVNIPACDLPIITLSVASKIKMK